MKSICGGIRKSCLFAMLWGTALAFAVETNSVWVDYRDACVVSGAVRVASSSGDASALPKVDGAVASGWTADAPAWDTSSVEDGWHVLSIAGESATLEVLTVNDESIAVHEGILQSDEVWGADKVHVVRDWVRIPEGKKLIIANGAVVKFCKDSGILNQGTLSAVSAVLTAIEDDTVGGDTNLDGGASSPVANSYAIQNEGTLNAINNAMRYATSDSVFASTSISENAFRGCGEITEVIVPADVVSVAGNAFGDCVNLKDVTFLGSETGVARNAFDGCSSVETLNFPGGMPDSEFPVGRSNPTVYVNDNALPETWSGYTVVDVYAGGILEKTLLVPEEEGDVGQVLTVTEDGYEWKDIPVDGELDAESTNAVQNKVVTAAINELKEVDNALKDKDEELEQADASLKESGDALAQTVGSQGDVLDDAQDDISELQSGASAASLRMDGIQQATSANQNALGVHQAYIEDIHETDQAQDEAIQELQRKNEELSRKLEEVLSVLAGGKEYDVLTKGGDGGYSWQPADFGGEVMKISLEEGWNLVAMPGRIVFDESSASAIDDIEIYTYDKKQKVYIQSEGLEPLASYWMRAPKACTIHFLVVDEKNQQTQE